jgi:hypothetical protein
MQYKPHNMIYQENAQGMFMTCCGLEITAHEQIASKGGNINGQCCAVLGTLA